MQEYLKSSEIKTVARNNLHRKNENRKWYT